MLVVMALEQGPYKGSLNLYLTTSKFLIERSPDDHPSDLTGASSNFIQLSIS